MKRAWIAGVALALTACSGGGSDSGDEADAMEIADNLQGSIDSITEVVEITEDNDPNGDIGRPGKYDQAVSISDSRAECLEEGDLGVDCGAKIEVWDDEAAAKERSEFILNALEGAQILGSEYHYLDGAVLLRVSGQLKPSEAEEYEQAFAS